MIRINTGRWQLLLALLVVACPAAANPSPYPATAYPVSFADVAALPPAQGAIPHAYGSAPSQYGLLWLPRRDEPAPLVVLFHGGCWLAEYDVDHIQPLASTLARAGYAVWAPEYRRVGEDGGGWPGTFDDARAALAASARLDPERIDSASTVLVGHSAGGQLALWLATRGSQPAEGVTLRGTVGLAAITDLAAYSSLHEEEDNQCAAAVPRLLGGAAQTVPERYRGASPSRADGPAVATRLLHGSDDGVVPLAQSRALPGAELEILDGAGHYDLIHPGTPALPALLSALEDLLSP